MVININKKADELKLYTPDLMTRHVGRIMYETIRKQVRKMSEGETLVLDFGGIKVIDSSFIDEMIVKLILDSKADEREFYIKLKNISGIAETNIDLVLRSHSSYKNKKIVVITENICQNNVFFIGPLTGQERDIIEFLRVNKSVTLTDVVQFTGRSLEKAKEIMNELHSMRIVKLQEGAYFWI